MKDRMLVMPHIWISTMVDLIRTYYDDHNPCGGSLHVWVDEGNYQETHVRHCLEYATERGDRAGATIAFLGLLLTPDEREWFADQDHPWSEETLQMLRAS